MNKVLTQQTTADKAVSTLTGEASKYGRRPDKTRKQDRDAGRAQMRAGIRFFK